MPDRRLVSVRGPRLLLLAAIVAVLWALPSFASAPLVMAQTAQCYTGVLINIGSQSCEPLTTAANCYTGYTNNAGTCLTGNYTQCSGGGLVAYGTYCQTNGYTPCPNGSVTFTGTACPASSYAQAQTAAVRYCASTSASPNPVPCSGTGTTAASQYCAGSMASAYPQLCSTAAITAPTSATTNATATTSATTNANANSSPALSTQLVVCPGTGATVSTSSQCPQTCPNGQILPPSQTCPAGSASAGTSTATASTSSGQGASVNLRPGWNLVGGPTGASVNGTVGSLFTFQGGDTAYETVSGSGQLTGGKGYWVYVTGATTLTLPAVSASNATVSLPAGQFVMVGNPGDTAATLTGADTVLVFDPTSNTYTQTSSLQPGAGAWVMSNGGGQLTITNAAS